jgi:hypothetical protein
MAIRPLFELIQGNFEMSKSVTCLAGDALVRSPYTGLCIVADRSLVATAYNSGTGAFSHTAHTFVGFAADDHARTGATMILPDPVGSTVVSSDGSTFTASNNGFYAVAKRALGDFVDELVTNVSDPTSGSTGYQGPRRGIGVYTSPSGQFVTDRFVAVITTAASTDDTNPYTFLPGDYLTFGATANAGKLVAIDRANPTFGEPVAKVDKYDATAGLLYFTQIGAIN